MSAPAVVRECGCVMPRGISCPHGHNDGEVIVLQLTPRLLDVPAAAAALAVGESTVWSLLDNGRGPLRSVKVGARRLIPVAALDEFVERLTKESA